MMGNVYGDDQVELRRILCDSNYCVEIRVNWLVIGLVTQVVAKYSIDKVQAQRDVDAVRKGRQL